jgi:hypothetical protein
MRKKSLLTYGLLAGVGYMLYKHMQTVAAPAVAIAAPAPTVAGFGTFPSGADRPFAHMSIPGAGQPFARYNRGVRWY